VTDPAAFNVVGEYDCGWTFEVDGQQIYYPAAGRRSFSPTLADIGRNYTNIVNDENGVGLPVGFYWSSDSPGVHSLAFDGAYINPGAAPRRNTTESAAAGGFPLRCVEE
jgi:hypothetical protein